MVRIAYIALMLPLLLGARIQFYTDEQTGSDPACVDGALAYRTDTNKWRKCENTLWSDIGGAAGANSFGTIGSGTPAVADIAGDTLTITDSGTIDFTTTNDPEDLTAIVIADSINSTHLNAGAVEGELEAVLDILDLQDGAADACGNDEYVKRNATDTGFECAPLTGASAAEPYLVVSATGGLSADRVFVGAVGIGCVDGGANGSFSCSTDSTDGDFLATGTTSPCTAGEGGAITVIDGGPLNYCDGNEITPTHRFAAYADSSGNALTGDSATSFFSAGTLEDDRVDGSLEAGEVVGTETDEAFCSWEATGSLIQCDLASVTDALVDDTITASNYLPLAGGTLTGNLSLSADANEGVDGGGLSDCDGDTQTLGWDTTTKKFTCGDDDSAAGSTGTLIYHVEGFTGCCATTDYMGAGSNNANCNATEANVDVTHTGPTLTVGNLKCRQKTDSTCTAVFTIMKNGAASAASTCTSTNLASCAASTTTETIANGDTWSIRVVDNASTCGTGCEVSCDFTATF